MPHAMQIRQTGGPEVLNSTAVDLDVAADMQSATAGYGGKFLTSLGNTGIQAVLAVHKIGFLHAGAS
jgi:hypothetical protein